MHTTPPVLPWFIIAVTWPNGDTFRTAKNCHNAVAAIGYGLRLAARRSASATGLTITARPMP